MKSLIVNENKFCYYSERSLWDLVKRFEILCNLGAMESRDFFLQVKFGIFFFFLDS